ncbi:hypothetical protein CPT_Scapp_048 [Serratia phage Scapp]|uniref:ParE-like toxin domain-containing protein n=1 Tax=Serratia phage Scapp TaxID=2282409 RepID=A0A345L6S5_9CAUD|nr:hypothetical protein PP898_gp48 [Serratia phage Scapp]AXH50977.1 hypothetical protein CPT_Scapp_048 [Serratia phage Scapp]
MASPRVPSKIAERAAVMVRCIREGTLTPRRAKHVLNVRVVDIGKRWRLVSVDFGITWQPMSHEAYNREVSKCSQRF